MGFFDAFVAWWKMRQASHYVALAFGLFVAAFVGYAPFHTLIFGLYHALPGWAEVLIGAGLYLITLYKPNLLKAPVTLDTGTAQKNTTAPKAAALLLVGALSAGALMTTGCTASQINKVVAEIDTYLPTAVSLLNEAITIYSAVGTSSTESTKVTAALTTVQTDLTNLETPLNDYLSATSGASKTTAWSNVKTLVDTAVTDADTLLQTAAVKNSNSYTAGITVIASLDAAVHVIDGYVTSTESSSEVKATAERRAVKLRTVSGYWSASDRQMIARAAGVPYGWALRTAEAAGF